MVIGCGGVAGVAIRKCCANSQVFDEVCIASRTLSKCDALKAELEGSTETKITTAQVDAGNVAELTALIKRGKAPGGFESGPSISGSDHHGGLPSSKNPLYGYCQLRTGGYGEI